jgi:antitoxin ParD1/3/4
MQSTHVNVRIGGALKEHLNHQISGIGLYENASEYVRDLIRRDMVARHEAWDWLRQELEPALKADKKSYKKVTAAEVIARNRKSKK